MLAAYKRFQLDMQGGPSAEFLLQAKSRIPYIKAYENLVTAIFLNPEVSSVRCWPSEKEVLIGDIDLRLYTLGLLFLSVAGVRRQLNDSLMAVCVSCLQFSLAVRLANNLTLFSKLSGPSSYGKSKVLDSALCEAKVISQDARGVGRYGGRGVNTFYYSDISVSDILGLKADVFAFKHLARGVSAIWLIRVERNSTIPINTLTGTLLCKESRRFRNGRTEIHRYIK